MSHQTPAATYGNAARAARQWHNGAVDALVEQWLTSDMSILAYDVHRAALDRELDARLQEAQIAHESARLAEQV